MSLYLRDISLCLRVRGIVFLRLFKHQNLVQQKLLLLLRLLLNGFDFGLSLLQQSLQIRRFSCGRLLLANDLVKLLSALLFQFFLYFCHCL